MCKSRKELVKQDTPNAPYNNNEQRCIADAGQNRETMYLYDNKIEFGWINRRTPTSHIRNPNQYRLNKTRIQGKAKILGINPNGLRSINN